MEILGKTPIWQNCDTVAILAQIGRFDLVSLLLAVIGVILLLGGVFAFFNFRSVAKDHAQAEAKIVCAEVAERITNEYLQAELPDIIEAYLEDTTEKEETTENPADKIAASNLNATEDK